MRVGGQGWSAAIHEVIVQIISQQARFFVQVGDNFVEVGVRGDGFDAYLALEPDGVALHNLNIPSC